MVKIRRRENIRSRERRRSFSQALEPNEHSLVFRRGKNRAKIAERFGTAARANGNFTIVDHSSKSLSPREFHRALYSGYRRCQQYFDPSPSPSAACHFSTPLILCSDVRNVLNSDFISKYRVTLKII